MNDDITSLPDNRVPDTSVEGGINKSGRKEGKIVLMEGKQSSGKSLTAALWTYSDYCKGRPVYSNIGLKFPHKPLNFFDLTMRDKNGELEGATLFIDELNFYCDSRGSTTKLNKEFTQFILQVNKSDINVYGTTHEVSFLDLRLRKHFDYLVKPTCLPIRRADYEPPRVLKMDISNGPKQRAFHKTPSIDPTPYLGLYNTKNRINPFEQIESKMDAAKFTKTHKEINMKLHQKKQTYSLGGI